MNKTVNYIFTKGAFRDYKNKIANKDKKYIQKELSRILKKEKLYTFMNNEVKEKRKVQSANIEIVLFKNRIIAINKIEENENE